MKYGYFDDECHEYVITQPDTPLPWINYLGCEEYFGLISNTAGGYSFYRDARLRRLTRYRYNNAPLDTGLLPVPATRRAGAVVAFVAAAPARLEATPPHGLGYTVTGSLIRHRGETPTSCRRRDADPGRASRTGRGSRAVSPSAIEFCLWDAGGRDQLPAELLDGRGRGRGRRIYHKTEYRSGAIISPTACSEPLAGSTRSARRSRPVPRLGATARRRARRRRLDRARWRRRLAPRQPSWPRRRGSSSCWHNENPRAQFDPLGRRRSTSAACAHRAYRRSEVEAAFQRCATRVKSSTCSTGR
jgi:hypothetical protein